MKVFKVFKVFIVLKVFKAIKEIQGLIVFKILQTVATEQQHFIKVTCNQHQ